MYTVPETSYMTLIGGVNVDIETWRDEQKIRYIALMIRLQIGVEDYFSHLASLSGQPSVILCDGGVMDYAALLTPDQWQLVMDENGWNPVTLRDKRYDVVIHMVSAADGAEKFFVAESGVKGMSVEEAIVLDKKIVHAWVGHPHFL